jgi:hypothetical protein
MKNKFAVTLAAAAFASFASTSALADPTVVTLGNGFGSLAGEFNAHVTGGTFTSYQSSSVLNGTGASFVTFCLEKNEYFSGYTQPLYVKAVNTGAVNGGVDGPSQGNFDPISVQTAYLYTQFSKGTLSSYDYGGTSAVRAADADALQNAFWYLEGELGTQSSALFNTLSAQTKTWITEANTSGWTGIGNVRVLNLYTSPSFGTSISQDQLFMLPVPEPETYAMMLAGLGLIGFVANRRRRKLV